MVKKKIEAEIQILKITNPLWVESLSGHIKDYWEKVKIPGTTYESLMAFLIYTVQYGGELAEMWCAFKDNQPVGFAMWAVMPPPIFGVSHCEHICSWAEDDGKLTKKFMEKFIEFAEKRRTPYLHANLINQKVADYFKVMVEDLGFEVNGTGKVELMARRK